MITHTRTYVTLEVSAPAYTEIFQKLKAAGYDHALDEEENLIDMQGIALKCKLPQAERITEVMRACSDQLDRTAITEEHVRRIENPVFLGVKQNIDSIADSDRYALYGRGYLSPRKKSLKVWLLNHPFIVAVGLLAIGIIAILIRTGITPF